ncbi:restriction endonuclease subunit S [Mycoplasma aquilae ATCC BAA-1896]|uniref:restriction endonuclease subunit S n=1 Tax=Mycoplasma aquilae TaxID=1312741 RepID=UPI003A86918D
MQKQKLAPEIRFSGYNTEWNLKTLEQIVEITFGQSPLSIYYTDKKTDHILVQGNADVKNRWVYPRIYTSQITKRAFIGDIIFSVRAPVGSVARSNYDIVIGRGVAAIKGDDFIYFNLLWKEISQFWKSKSSGSTFDSIASLELEKSEISVPSDLSEQQKIGQFFSNLDSLIQSQELKLEKLNEVKQSLLNKMFALKNQKFPQIRFKGFEDEWNLDKVCNLFKITRGEVLSQNQISEFQNEIYTYPVYSSQTLRNGLMGYYKEYLFENCITWTTDGANAGTVKFRNEKFYCTNVCGVLEQGILKPNSCVAELLNIVAPNYVTRAGNPKLMNSTMGEIMINYPNSTIESSKISTLFMSIDSLISSQELKLEKLNNIKQALLEKMFC